MKKNEKAEQMRKRYARLTARVAKLGVVLQGTITERTIAREDPKVAGGEKIYGPYYQWTFKRDGRTVTVNLTAGQAKAYGKAIDNHRILEEITQQMRELSLQILDATTEGVAKRKPRK
jgi:hypothetical protein